jgi:sugar/nucleoside kinase (ribokinase family)
MRGKPDTNRPIHPHDENVVTATLAFQHVTVFGGLTIDRIARTDTAPAMSASNPGTVRTSPGGVGLNVATTLAQLGLSVGLVAIVGRDADGASILSAAREAGIDTDAIITSATMPTATYQAVLDDKGELVLGVADMKVYEELDATALASVVTGPRTGDFWVIDANFAPEPLAFLVREANAGGKMLAALAISPAKATRLRPVLNRLTFVFANRREAAAILGYAVDDRERSTPDLAAELARKSGADVILTDADKPLHVVSSGETRTFAPLPANIRNVNGAGDALAAGTIYGLARGEGLFSAIRYGLAAAALSLESDETVRSDLVPSLILERTAAGA